jgi:hypothetical protein
MEPLRRPTKDELIRRVRETERERCAKIAERIGVELHEYAVGGAIATAIRNQD